MKRHKISWYYWFILYFVVSDLQTTECGKIPMRIVRETASYGYFGNSLGDIDNRDLLIARAKPSNFSGPVQLRRLLGNCYNITLDRYRYVFCPFQNMTQYEISNRWNAYQGILGIWSHWNIENNTFQSMMFAHGDLCEDTDRSVEVFLHCGSKEVLANVTEPKKCQYKATFITKLVCHKDSLLVYPRLTREMQKEWDDLLTQFHIGDLTEKGYNIKLQKLFQEADLTREHAFADNTVPPETDFVTTLLEDPFADLSSCNKEYKSLKEKIMELNREIESLKLMLDLNNIGNRNEKPNTS